MSHPFKATLYRLFFTKEDELDLGYLLLLVGFFNAVVFFDLSALGYASISLPAWSFMGGVIGMCFIAGSTIAKARLIANSTMVGDLTKGIASARSVEASTDVQELSANGTKTLPDEI